MVEQQLLSIFVIIECGKNGNVFQRDSDVFVPKNIQTDKLPPKIPGILGIPQKYLKFKQTKNKSNYV